MKKCNNCWHGRGGGCKLYSCDCATAVLNQKEEIPRWLSYNVGYREEREEAMGLLRKEVKQDKLS